MKNAEKALESRARRAAKREGLLAVKNRYARVPDLYDGFSVFDADTRLPVFGFKYELDAQDVIDYCEAPSAA